VTGEQLLQTLESRLDNLVYRLGFASSRRAARQFVTHSHVLLNGRRASVPSMHVKAGTTISVRSNKKSRELAARSLQLSEGRGVPKWLTLDAKNFQGTLDHIPSRDEIAPNVNEQLVVELYSK
jgi:small subunit ribosomal protein S4